MEPKVSFVVTARNDNYGGNFLHRMQVFVNALLAQWRQHHLQAELVIVEWNPPENAKPLAEALVWPDALLPGTVRIVQVPNELHQQLPNSDRMPMFEYIAKNVGIRRARGEYILATNPDILFSDKLIRFLASGKLSHDAFYRVDRYDVARTIPLDVPLEKQLRFCEQNAIRMNTLGISVTLNRWLPFSVRVWFANRSVRRLRDSQLRRKVRVEDRLHTNASGDFLPMSQEVWFSLKGYPERKTSSHIDSYMCCMAASAGVNQIILPSEMRIYHQEHSRSSSSSRPMTSYEVWEQDCERMLRQKRPLIKNDSNWGLGHENLAEFDKFPMLEGSD